MFLSTAFEAAPFTILGDVPLEPPAGAPWWVAHLYYVLPALGFYVFSTVVGEVNDSIRKRDAEGVPVSPRLRFIVAVLNRLAANHDKARQQAAVAKSPGVKP